MIDINIYKKDRTVCKTCYNKNKRKNNNDTLPTKKINTSYQQPNVENVNNKVSKYENHRHVVVGPSNVEKTYYMLKVLAKIATAAATNSPKAALSTLPEVINFYHTGKGLYLGKFV